MKLKLTNKKETHILQDILFVSTLLQLFNNNSKVTKFANQLLVDKKYLDAARLCTT